LFDIFTITSLYKLYQVEKKLVIFLSLFELFSAIDDTIEQLINNPPALPFDDLFMVTTASERFEQIRKIVIEP